MTHEEYRNTSLESKEQAQRILFSEYFNYVYTIVFSKLRSCASRGSWLNPFSGYLSITSSPASLKRTTPVFRNESGGLTQPARFLPGERTWKVFVRSVSSVSSTIR